jgi:hypothetical protein
VCVPSVGRLFCWSSAALSARLKNGVVVQASLLERMEGYPSAASMVFVRAGMEPDAFWESLRGPSPIPSMEHDGVAKSAGGGFPISGPKSALV